MIKIRGDHFWCSQHGSYPLAQLEKHKAVCHGLEIRLPGVPQCLYLGCNSGALLCDSFCDVHRQEFGLYRPTTYAQAYAKARARWEATGKKHFVYRHRKLGQLHKGYGTSRVTKKNWTHAIFSEVVFPEGGLVSTHTAQKMMFCLHNKKLVE